MKTVKNTIALYLIQFGGYIPPLITYPYLAHILGPENLGIVGHVQAIFGILSIISGFGFDFTNTREVSISKDKESVNRLYWSTLLVKISVVLLLIVGLYAIYLLKIDFVTDDRILWLGCLFLCGNILSTTWLFQGLEIMPRLAAMSLIIRVMMVIPVFLSVHTPEDLTLAALFLFVPDLLIGICSNLYVFKKKLIGLPQLLDKKQLSCHLKSSFDVLLSSFCTIGYTHANILILQFFAGDVAVGIYTAAEKITRPIIQLFNPLVQSLYPKVCQLYSDGAVHNVRSIMLTVICAFFGLSLIIFIGVEIWGHWVVIQLFGKKFEEVFSLLRVMIALPLIIGIATTLVTLGIIAGGKQAILKKIYIVGSIIHVIQCPILIKNFGTVGSCYSVIMTEMIMTALLFIALRSVFFIKPMVTIAPHNEGDYCTLDNDERNFAKLPSSGFGSTFSLKKILDKSHKNGDLKCDNSKTPSMFKNTLFMTLSTAVRLLAGVVLFIILARLLGPEDFGRLMYGFTLASIAVLVIEYGFSQQLLREIGKAPAEVCYIMGRVFLAKMALTFLVVIGGVVAFVLFPKSIEDQQIYWLLFLSSLLASFADFFNVAFRGIGHFHEETKIATASSIYHFGVIVFLAYLHSDLIVIAQGFVASRAFNLGYSWIAYRRIVGKLELGGQSFKKIIGMLKSGFPYAADAGFSNLFSQIDVLIVNHYLGSASLGLYQAGMRFLQGACQFAPVLGNVYLPAIAGCGDKPEELTRLAKKLNTQMLVVGAAGWFIFSFGGDWITHIIYGEKYSGLSPLWSYIGLLLFFRYIAASQGVLLTANGAQSVRVLAQIVCFFILFFISPLLIERYQLIGMLVTMQLTLGVLFLIYFYTLIIKKTPTGFGALGIFISVVVLIMATSLFYNQDVVTKLLFTYIEKVRL